MKTETHYYLDGTPYELVINHSPSPDCPPHWLDFTTIAGIKYKDGKNFVSRRNGWVLVNGEKVYKNA